MFIGLFDPHHSSPPQNLDGGQPRTRLNTREKWPWSGYPTSIAATFTATSS